MRSAPTRCASRWSTAPRPGPTSASDHRASTARATSPTRSGMPPASCSAPSPPELPAEWRSRCRDARPAGPGRALDPVALPCRPARGRRGLRRRSSSRRPRASCTRPSGPSTVTGTWRWPRCAWAPTCPSETSVATWQVLAWVLDRYLRMLHPVMPHITEEIWGRLPHRPDDGDLLITAAWPVMPELKSGADEEQAAAVADILELVSQMRNARADAGIEPAIGCRPSCASTRPTAREAFDGHRRRRRQAGARAPDRRRARFAADAMSRPSWSSAAWRRGAPVGRGRGSGARPRPPAKELAETEAQLSPRRARSWPTRASWQGARGRRRRRARPARRSWRNWPSACAHQPRRLTRAPRRTTREA